MTRRRRPSVLPLSSRRVVAWGVIDWGRVGVGVLLCLLLLGSAVSAFAFTAQPNWAAIPYATPYTWPASNASLAVCSDAGSGALPDGSCAFYVSTGGYAGSYTSPSAGQVLMVCAADVDPYGDHVCPVPGGLAAFGVTGGGGPTPPASAASGADWGNPAHVGQALLWCLLVGLFGHGFSVGQRT